MRLPVAKAVAKSIIKNRIKVPLVFMGHKGNGKTQTFKDLAKEEQIPLSILRLGSMNDVGDLLGMPYVNAQGETMYGPPEWYTIIKNGGILVIDELTRCKPMLIDAAMQILDERRFGPYVLPDNTSIFGISNPITESDNPANSYDLNDIDAALADRCCFIRIESQTIQDGLTYLMNNSYDPLIMDLVALSEGQMDQGSAFTLPQKDYTWRGVRQLNELMPVIKEIPEAATELVLGCIGSNGLSVWNNRKILKEIPTAEEYFKNKNLDISNLSGIHVHVFLTRVIAYLRDKRATADICQRFTDLCAKLPKQMLMYIARVAGDPATPWINKFIALDNTSLKQAAKELMETITTNL